MEDAPLAHRSSPDQDCQSSVRTSWCLHWSRYRLKREETQKEAAPSELKSRRTLKSHGMQLVRKILEAAREANGISERRLRHGVACACLPAVVEIDVLVAEVEQASSFDCSGGVQNERLVDGCLGQ